MEFVYSAWLLALSAPVMLNGPRGPYTLTGPLLVGPGELLTLQIHRPIAHAQSVPALGEASWRKLQTRSGPREVSQHVGGSVGEAPTLAQVMIRL